MADPIPERCTINAWRPKAAGIAEVFHAHIIDYAYPPHCHDTWTVLIVDDGAIDYALDNKRHSAVAATVTILPPGVIHDGRPEARARHGFRKRNLYLDSDFLPTNLIGSAVYKTVIADPDLRKAISGLHDSLGPREEHLNSETRLALISERIRLHLEGQASTAPLRAEFGLAARLREYLDERVTDAVSIDEAAASFGRSVPHLVRSFSNTFGVSPYAYVIGKRIERARELLLRGTKPADVALQAGFYDQAHLNRHFKRHTATTPARFARGYE